MKLHLVDGTYELFRAYYGAPPAHNAAGMEVGAVRSLVRSLISLLREDDVTHVGVAFDTVIESFRNTLFAGYKTGADIDPPLLAQFPLAEEAAAALGLVVWPMVAFEADDAVATAVALWSGQVEQTIICSVDKDFAQCVRGDAVVLRDRRRQKELNEAGVRAKFGVAPASIPDWLALVGDSADGLPGVPKWGAKSAAVVLAHYGHIEAIAPEAAKWPIKVRGAEALARSLQACRSEALLYRQLATLRTDVPMLQTLEDLRWRKVAKGGLERLGVLLHDDSLGDRLPAPR